MTRPRPAEPCSCGCTYDRFTTGLTFASVREMMTVGQDPTTWRNKGRHGVLGFWRELKLQLWATHVSECTPPPPVPF